MIEEAGRSYILGPYFDHNSSSIFFYKSVDYGSFRYCTVWEEPDVYACNVINSMWRSSL